MAKKFEGNLIGRFEVRVVISRFNEFFSAASCWTAPWTPLTATAYSIQMWKWPGRRLLRDSLIAQKMAEPAYNAVICLGAIIRGGTPHFDYIAAEVSKAWPIPASDRRTHHLRGNHTDTLEQAIERPAPRAATKASTPRSAP
jgi:6,7-dimethyl-8-ribityllumazine synthase